MLRTKTFTMIFILLSTFLLVACDRESSDNLVQTSAPLPLTGTWHYQKSTEDFGENERLLSTVEVEMLHGFEINKPHLELRDDYTIYVDYIDYGFEATLEQAIDYPYDMESLIQSSEYAFEIFPVQPSEYHTDNDILTYDSESGMLRLTLSLSCVNHYFSKEVE